MEPVQPFVRGLLARGRGRSTRRLRATVLVAALVCSLVAWLGAAAPAEAAPVPTGRLPRAAAGAPTSTFLVEAVSARAATTAARQVTRAGGAVTRRYTEVLTGFAATLTRAQARALRAKRGVLTVVADRKIIANPCLGCPPEAQQRERVRNWGLLRLSSRGRVSLEPQSPDGPLYTYDSDGEGVTAFVLDSGIDPGAGAGSGELAGRLAAGYDFVSGDGDAADCTRHGTRVAGIIGGNEVGVADRVSVVPLRVFDCSNEGWWSTVLAALDWTLTHRPAGPAVVNLSGAGHAFALADRAVRRVIAAGLPVVVSAGNVRDDACRYSPARVPGVLTVAASDIADRRAPSSNAGPCVDLFAPGAGIATTSGSVTGTSFAAAHVTGAVARYLENHRTARPAAVARFLTENATTGAVSDVRKAPNRLLYLPAPVAPGAPRDVRWTQDDTANTVTAAWSPPADRGSAPVTSYGVCFTATDVVTQFPGPVCTYTPTASARTLTVEDLEDGGLYSFFVVAVSKAGSGLSATTDVRMAFRLPSAPGVSTVVDEEVLGILVWVDPGEQYGTGPITGYQFSRDGTDQDGNGPVTVTLDTTNRFYEFTNLVRGRPYNFSVALVTAQGVGAATTVQATYPG